MKKSAGASDPLTDAVGTVHVPSGEAPRIVSLVPSLTELICDLGLARFLVGRSGFCIHPREVVRTIPKMGGTKDANIERIREAKPTHLVVNIDENRREQVDELAQFVPHVIVTHPLVPEDNIALFRLFGGIFGAEQPAQHLEHEFTGAMTALSGVRELLLREKVLYLIWKKPWMTISQETYVSAMLAAAGWDSVPAASDVRYPVVEPPLTAGETPDFLLLSSEPYHFREKHIPEAESAFGIPARLIDGEMVSWYGSRSIAGLRYLAALRQGH